MKYINNYFKFEESNNNYDLIRQDIEDICIELKDYVCDHIFINISQDGLAIKFRNLKAPKSIIWEVLMHIQSYLDSINYKILDSFHAVIYQLSNLNQNRYNRFETFMKYLENKNFNSFSFLTIVFLKK